jgi:hypothetical protein
VRDELRRNTNAKCILFLGLTIILFSACQIETGTPMPATATSVPATDIARAGPGAILYTHIFCPENGEIAVRIDLPEVPRYGGSAPIVVVASTWFVDKYNDEQTPFHLEFNPVDMGVITISHLWPGKTDPDSLISSEGTFDFGGPNSLAALRDTLRFALGEITDIDGRYLHELISFDPLCENVGMFASSHAGVVATNVMA